MKKIVTILLTSLVLLAGCDTGNNPSDSNDNGIIDTADLQDSISNAETLKSETVISDLNGSEVPLGTYWVTQTVMDTFDADINTAKNALSAKSQTVVNSAKATLDVKITEFTDARKPGTAEPVNKTALEAKIAEAKLEKEGIVVASNAGDVALGKKYVTQAVMDTFTAAITSAINARTATKQTDVDNAVSVLNTAIATFKEAQQNGSKTTGFTQTELNALIAEANAAKTGVNTSTQNGDDISPVAYWVSQSALTAFENAISAAQTLSDENYLALVEAINTFKNAKQLGSTPDKEALFNAIRTADDAKDGVVVAGNASQVSFGLSWATPAQWSPLNTAYTNASNAASSSSATKNEVAAQTTALTTATSTFISAVNSNGPGTKHDSNVIMYTFGDLATQIGIKIPAEGIMFIDFLIEMQEAGYISWSIPFYNNEALTQTFNPFEDIVYPNTVFYCEYTIENFPKRTKLGEITGTISLTDVPSPLPEVTLIVNCGDENMWIAQNTITLSGSGTLTNIKWSLPLYEDSDEFYPDYGRFFMDITLANGASFNISISTTPYIGNVNANVGNLGTYSLKTVTLSGTINASYNGQPINAIYISAYTTPDNINGSASLFSPATTNAPWSMTIPAPTSLNNVTFFVMCRDDTYDTIFEKSVTPASPVQVYNTNVTGIILNIGNITKP